MKLEEMVGKMMTEAQFDEAAGEKDACYRKVKARYDVWPSAYASGALVKCRKVGAKNWGNKSKKEGVDEKAFSSSIIAKAIKVAKSMGGNMTAAVKKIEKMEKGLSKNGRVEFALQKANESVNEGIFGKFDTGAGFKGNGMTIYDRNQEKAGDYKDIAHIAPNGKLTIYDKNVKKEPKLMQSLKKISQEFKTTFKESVNEGQKKQASMILRKFDMAFIKFSREIRDVIKLVDRSTGSKVDGKIIEKAYEKGLIPLNKIMIEWDRGQQENPGLSEDLKESVDEAYDIWMEDGSFGGTFTGLVEAEYQGRKVKLGKPMQGDSKKFKVYVKNPKGNVVKVNFGQGGDAKGGTMRIRKSNPKARANFRARHNCDSPGPRHKARYWSCRKW